MRTSTARPSAALVLTVIALVLALAGSAIAGPEAMTSALTPAEEKAVNKIARKAAKKIVRKRSKKIARKEADARITARAPELAVARAADAETIGGLDSSELLTTNGLAGGKTLRGVFAIIDVSPGAGFSFGTSISFPVPIASNPTPHYNRVGFPVLPGCFGNAANPGAAPGHLCLFESRAENRQGTGLICNPATGGCNAASRFGARVSVTAAAAAEMPIVVEGTWAVTAP